MLSRNFFLLCAGLLLCAMERAVESQRLRKEAFMTVPQLITAAGYPVEKHRARTEDGYILQMHRIPAGRRTARRTDTGGKGKRAVLLMHGMMGSSGDYVIMGPERSIAYLLADAGYDVWLGNQRGNSYTAHTNLTKDDPSFWDYSFHEHGKYDLPAMVDKVLNITGLQKVMYLGFSMGTTSFFIMASERPEYNDKIVAFVGMAPAVYLDNMKQLAQLGLRTMDVGRTLRSRGMNSLSFRPELIQSLVGNLCNTRQPQTDMCMRIAYSLVGEDYEQNDWDMSPVIIARIQPASLREIEHYGKIALNSVFTSWEDGLWGEVRPYNLTNVRVPVTLLYGENDQLTEKSQIMRLARVLNSTGMLTEIRAACQWPKFNHLDFVFAKDVGDLLNRPLLTHIRELFEKYEAL